MSRDIKHIFDRIFKRIGNLSDQAVIHFINGMFQRNYDAEVSIVRYLSQEMVNDENEKTEADMIIEINGLEKFHLECQISNDETMAIRMFEYGYADAKKHKEVLEGKITLHFAEPKVIYLQHTKTTPDKLEIDIVFQNRGTITYRVDTIKLLDKSASNLLDEKLIVLIPFYLLKMRNIATMPVERQLEHIETFRNLLEDEIFIILGKAYKQKLITDSDYKDLMLMLQDVYEYLYGDVRVLEGVSDMLADKTLLWSERIKKEMLEKGIEEGKQEMVMELLKLGLEIDKISLASGLSKEKILKLKEQL